MERLSMTACPACDHVNVEQALTCVACGSPLVARCPSCRTINARTRTRCHYCATLLIAQTTQPIGLDDDPGSAPASAPAPAPEAPPAASAVTEVPPQKPAMPAWKLTLRADRMPVPPRQKPARAPAAPRKPAPGRQAVVESDPPATAEPAPTARDAGDTESQSHWADAGGDLSERKAEVRAAVRRARLRQQRRGMKEAGTEADVLLLEPDESARARIAALLHQFGFRAHAVATVSEAEKMLGTLRFAAAFVGIGPKSSEVADFCRELHAAEGADQRPHALVAMIDAERHADRVRVELAGADTVLTRPVMRGHVAQSLEECGVPLPHDPRAVSKRGLEQD